MQAKRVAATSLEGHEFFCVLALAANIRRLVLLDFRILPQLLNNAAEQSVTRAARKLFAACVA